jgi:hypothetical protein
MTGIRRAGWVVAAVIAGVGASGCVSIPDSSGVGQASEVGVTDQPQPIVTVAQGPSPGSIPQSIVYGFFSAMQAYPPNIDVVRQFLTPDAVGSWNPDAGVSVYTTSPTVSTHGKKVHVNMETSGSLDARGSWTSSLPVGSGGSTRQATVSRLSTERDYDLRIEKVGGEWRIATPPSGTFVSTDYFIRYYRAFSLYFFDPTQSILAPDQVYLPIGDTAATALVQGLLQGPTARLFGAVATAAPAGTRLEVSVSVSGTGVADVPLSSDVLTNLASTERELFAAQLAWTLRQIDGVRRIAITVDGTPLPIENVGSTFDAYGFAAYDPAGLAGERRLFALGPSGLVTVSKNAVVHVPGPIGRIADGDSVAVQTSGQLAAVVTDDDTTVMVGPIGSGTAVETGGVAKWFTSPVPLLRPSWDARQALWLVDHPPLAASGGRSPAGSGLASAQRILVMTDVKHGPYDVRVDWLGGGQRIEAFSVSRDGVRFAAIVAYPDGTRRLVISTIVRKPGGLGRDQVSLRRPEIIQNEAAPLVRLRDLAWVSPTSLAVLAAEADRGVATYEVAIDGSDIEAAGGFLRRGVVPTSIAAGPNTDAPIAIATEAGNIDVQAPDLGWSEIGGPLWAPAYPG